MLDKKALHHCSKKSIHIYAKAKFPVIDILIKAGEQCKIRNNMLTLKPEFCKVKHNIER